MRGRPTSLAGALVRASEQGSARLARISRVSEIEGGHAVGKDKNDGDTTDGGRHDVGRDGQTGKTADDIDPKEYGEEEK